MIEPSNPAARRLLTVALAAVLFSPWAPRQAQAQPRGPGDAALAEGLFQDARRLMDEGKQAEACPKLAESQRLDPAGGTALLLGLCHEGVGRWASAWAAYNDAVGLAIKDGRADREQRAKERLVVVEARMVRLRLRAPAGALAAVGWVRVGEREIPRAAWTSPIPLDPGVYRVSGGAPGSGVWSVEIKIGDGGGEELVELPSSLPPGDPAPAAPARPSALPAGKPAPPYAAYGLLGVGLAGLGLGAALGAWALRKDGEADRRCPQVTCGDLGAVRLSSEARAAARASDVSLVVGATAAAAGVALWVWQRPGGSVALGARPSASGGWLSAAGAF